MSATWRMIGRLAGHVRAGDDEDLVRRRVELEVVGHEGLAPASLDHRVAAVLDRGSRRRRRPSGGRSRGGRRTRPGPARTSSAATSAADPLQAQGLPATVSRTSRNRLVLEVADALLGAEDLLLVLLELRRDEALGVDQRLLAHVVGRDPVQVRLGDLDVVAEDLVVADLERADAGALPLAASSWAMKPLPSRLTARSSSSSAL